MAKKKDAEGEQEGTDEGEGSEDMALQAGAEQSITVADVATVADEPVVETAKESLTMEQRMVQLENITRMFLGFHATRDQHESLRHSFPRFFE
jgi:hypothetical protein